MENNRASGWPYVCSVLKHWWTFEYRGIASVRDQWLATLFYNTVFALFLTAIFIVFIPNATFANSFVETLVVSHCIGICIHGAYEIVARLAPSWLSSAFPSRRRITRIAVPTLGAAIGWAIAFTLMKGDVLALLTRYPRIGLVVLTAALIMALVFYFISSSQTRLMDAQVREAQLAASAKSAELRALQAQIEPHFLFNTLANVQALIDYEPQKAKAMLDAFVQHLRLSLAHTRSERSTVGQELALVRTYLDILKIRLGDRLQARIEIAPGVEQVAIAPLLVQPLVENAVKYGVEPKVDGGTIVVRAFTEGANVRIDVSDDGLGLDAAQSTARAGTGLGLENIRERLKNTYAASASLQLTSLSPGTRATILFPKDVL
jgi:two-component sensor histidine kinase